MKLGPFPVIVKPEAPKGTALIVGPAKRGLRVLARIVNL